MYISRPSDARTVLLWGERWWFAGTGASCEFTNLGHAVEVLVAHYATEPKPVRLRLIYQPEILESVAVACPPGDRATLAAALAGEYPVLTNPDHAWGHEPVTAAKDGHATVLHYEIKPELFVLAVRLAHHGLVIESAWPLATFLQSLPDEWTPSGPVTVLALQAKRALAYRQSAENGREIHAWRGDNTIAEVGEWLSSVFDKKPDESVLLVAPDRDVASALDSFVPLAGYAGLEQARLADALARPVEFPRYHPAQLLPRTPVLTVERTLIAASLAFFLAAAWLGVAYARDYRAAQAAGEARRAEVAALRTEVAHLRNNAAEIAELRSLLEGGAAGPPCGKFLQKLSVTQPTEIVLSSLRISERTIVLSGWLAPAAPATVLEEWRSRLSPPGVPWTSTIKPGVGGTFTLTGAFQL